MPATIQGNASHNTSASAWQATHAQSTGDLVTPSPPTGQVFIAQNNGTTSGTQPSWSGPIFPTLGTTFVDGTVTWQMYGTEPGPWPVVLQVPVDSDPPLAFTQLISDQTLADQMAWLVANTGLLSANNTWTGLNTFTQTVHLTNGGLNMDNGSITLTNGGISILNGTGFGFLTVDGQVNFNSQYFILTATAMQMNGGFWGTNAYPGLNFTADPISGSGDVLAILGSNIGNSENMRVYAANSLATVPMPFSNSAMIIAVNAYWDGSSWQQNNTSNDASFFVFGDQSTALYSWQHGSSFSSLNKIFVISHQGGSAGYDFPLSFTNNGLQVTAGGLHLYAGGGNIQLDNNNIYATLGGINLFDVATGNVVAAGYIAAGGDVSAGSIHNAGAVLENGGQTTHGNYGVPTVLVSQLSTGLTNISPIDVLVGAGNCPAAGLFEIKIGFQGGTGASNVQSTIWVLTAPGYAGITITVSGWTDGGGGNSGCVIPFYATGSGAVTLTAQLAGIGTVTCQAALVAVS